MRIILQRVSSASVSTSDPLRQCSIGKGVVLFVGIKDTDTPKDIEWAVRKIATVKLFDDSQGKRELTLQDCNGSVLSISQITLYASVRKGHRVDFGHAGEPRHAQELWKLLNTQFTKEYHIPVEEGVFGADMCINLTNEGPFTLIIDTDDLALNK